MKCGDLENSKFLKERNLSFSKVFSVLRKVHHQTLYTGNLGYSLEIDVSTRMTSFWAKLVTSEEFKLSSDMYLVLLSHDKHLTKQNWVNKIRSILIECGLKE